MRLICLFIIGLLFVGCNKKQTKQRVILPYFNSYEFTPEWDKSKIKKHKIGEFNLVNQNGKKISNIDYKGKIYVANFFFTSCTGICNSLIKNTSILQTKLKQDLNVKFLSHSVTPSIDSIQKLKKYISYKKLNTDNWDFVTGGKNEIYKLARESYFADADYQLTKKPSSFIHSENFLLIDPNGYIRGVYNGTLRLEMDRLLKHITILESEFFGI